MFAGWDKGLSGTENNKTLDAPNGAINNGSWLIAPSQPIAPIPKVAPRPASSHLHIWFFG